MLNTDIHRIARKIQCLMVIGFPVVWNYGLVSGNSGLQNKALRTGNSSLGIVFFFFIYAIVVEQDLKISVRTGDKKRQKRRKRRRKIANL